VFALTLATSAALLFVAQPLVARMALPVLGGSPAVWNTCMVFFQAAVLVGYAFAHLLASRVCPQPQVGLFFLLIVVGGAGLPIALDRPVAEPPSEPVGWLLGRLAFEVGLPAFALATASPLLQRWFARVQSDSREPYFLYAASNAGSLGALLAYPFVLEPLLALSAQARLWTGTYWIWALGIVATAALLFHALRQPARGRPARFDPDPRPPTPNHAAARDPATGALPNDRGIPTRSLELEGSWSGRRVAAWISLSAVPASLLQGCTLFLTTDVAGIPLFWVVPLALYLLTFVVAFSDRGRPVVAVANRALPFLAAGLLYAILSRSTQPVLMLMALHLVFLFAAGLVCHGRLVGLRPPPAQLTAFYLALSAGGVLGGSFNALLAPRLFDSVAEYPIAIALAAAALTARPGARCSRGPVVEAVRDGAVALGFGLGIPAFGLVYPWLAGATASSRDAVVFGVAAVACCTQLDRPRRLALALAATFAGGLWLQGLWAGNRYAERNFFGLTRVTRSGGGEYHQLVHGNTIHGRQFLDPRFRDQPLTYYHRQGPLGHLFAALPGRPPDATPTNPTSPTSPIGPTGPTAAGSSLPARRIGVIGLGIGSMAAYALPDEDWTFFEIDPAVIRVAQDTNWFTFLARSRAGATRIVEGDARLRLAAEPDARFDLLLLDAFSSDAIPVHLLTREAVALYFRKLRPGGWLGAHISNRYLDLEPVVAALGADAGLEVRSANDMDEGNYPGKEASHWMVLARTRDDLRPLLRKSLWVPPDSTRRVSLWTDQRSALLPVFQWR
jgi:SAM-dependent methyltransferase